MSSLTSTLLLHQELGRHKFAPFLFQVGLLRWRTRSRGARQAGRFGIAGSPAIALEVTRLLQEAGFEAPADPTFNPNRAPIIFPKDGEEASLHGKLVYTPDDKETINAAGVPAHENVVCKCEKVTEAEVVEACRRSLPVDSTQTMRKRNRAGMGGCQGKPWNYGCECRVAQVIARQNQYGATEVVGRRPWKATPQFERRWLTGDDKAKLVEL